MSDSIPDRARHLVHDYIMPRIEKIDDLFTFDLSDVYVVWFAKTLENWKALVSTNMVDGMYYEVTHNGAANETYIDAYRKFDNVTVPD